MNKMILCCPICGKALQSKEKSMICENRHNFDIAKSGYVNLLMSNQSGSKRHGDDKLMVRSRHDFLEKGYYEHLLHAVFEAVLAEVSHGCVILDAGCGECYYTSYIYNHLLESGIPCSIAGVDISKAALSLGAKRNKSLELAVASVNHLPAADNSCDIILSIFAPCAEREFLRVLRDCGKLIRAVPLERHLWSLKSAVYDKPYENETEVFELEGFKLNSLCRVCRKIVLPCNEDIINLFRMTPYYYKTGIKDQQKLASLKVLETETEFGVLVYEKL